MRDLDNRLYRVQLADTSANPYYNRHAPVKRVSVLSSGEVEFNPDERKFIYFSKSVKHHSYYMYNKVVQIVNDELKFAKGRPEFAKLDLPDNMGKFLPSRYCALKYYNINTEVIKKLKNFFRNYLPPKEVELVSLRYLNCFGQLLENCVVKNSRKQRSAGPEVSDQTMYGGAYGINDTWLDLLKSSTISTKTAKFGMDQFFDFLMDETYFGVAGRAKLESLTEERDMFRMLGVMTYNELRNPKFYDKNNSNTATKIIDKINDEHLYNPNIELGDDYFREVKANFKQEIREEREM